MKTKLYTAPTIEPVTLSELEEHLRLNSNALADDIDSVQSIAPGAHVIALAYSLLGTGVDVLNYRALVVFSAGLCGAGGSVTAKIQESDDNVAFTDWTGGGFTAVTEANDNATYEKAYTGIKQYIRVVCTVAVATCAFGISVVRESPYSVEDTYLQGLIVAARRIIENVTNRRLIEQTWELALDEFPYADSIRIPYPPLISITSVTYYDVDEVSATFAATNYHVDTYGEPGNIVLADGSVWPSTTLRTVNGVVIRYVCGYGDEATDVPQEFRQAIKMLAAELYEHREATDRLYTTGFSELPYGVQMILGLDRVVPV